MRIIRLYQAIDLALGETITLNQATQHYVRQVLRCRLGDAIALFNGKGGEYLGQLVEITKQSVKISIESFNDKNVESTLSCHLGQALVSGDKMDFIIQKAVELGVSEITPIYSERSSNKLPKERLEKRMQHWQGIITSACEQCGRVILPELHAPLAFYDWLNVGQNTLALICDPRATTTLSDLKRKDGQAISVTIGAEGGFSAPEIDLAKQHGFQEIYLSPRVLRAETAAISAITLTQHIWGDM